MLHPDHYPAFVESIRASARDLTPWRQEYRVRFPDCEVRWLLGNAIPGRHAGSSILWHGFITDETEQRQARDEAMLTHSRMQAVVQGSTQLSIIGTDLEGIITVFNSGAERLLGYTTAEMIGLQTPQIIHLRSEVEARSQELSLEYGYGIAGRLNRCLLFVLPMPEKILAEGHKMISNFRFEISDFRSATVRPARSQIMSRDIIKHLTSDALNSMRSLWPIATSHRRRRGRSPSHPTVWLVGDGEDQKTTV